MPTQTNVLSNEEQPRVSGLPLPVTNISVGQRMLAACSGSLLTSVVVTPFDVIRVRMQQQSAFPAMGLAASLGKFSLQQKSFPVSEIPKGVGVTACCKDVFWYPSTIDYCVASELQQTCAIDDSQKKRVFGTWDGLKKISKQEGITALWRGLTITLVMAVPSNVAYYVSYEYMRDNSPIKSELLNPLICGSFARSLSATVISPLEMLKTRIQSVETTQNDALKVVMRGVKEMVATEGVKSLWKGLVLTLWRDVPFSGIYWSSVEFIRKRLQRTPYFQSRTDKQTFMETFIAGSLGGTFASIVTTPFDVGKTRKQIGHHGTASASMRMIPFMRSIIKNEGISALYVGTVPRVLRVAPACAIMISSYEFGKRTIDQYNSKC